MVTSPTVTVVFTDLVDSAALDARLGPKRTDEFRRAWLSALNDAIAGLGGELIKNLGDGIMAVFLSTSAALEAAVVMQQSVHAVLGRYDEEPMSLRVGISVGDATHEDDDWFGQPVVEAARLCDRASGGEILITDVVRLLAGQRVDCEFVELGSMTLKGLPQAVGAHRIDWSLRPRVALLELPARLRSSTRTEFVGREREKSILAAAIRSSADGSVQTVLVAGEPGVGKSSLLAEMGREALDEGHLVLAGGCDEALLVPYQAFVEALTPWVEQAPNQLLDAHVAACGPHLQRLVPAMAGRLGTTVGSDGNDQTDRFLMFDAVADLLRRTSAIAPVVLVLDDLHWAETPTLLLLRHLVTRLGDSPIVVVAAYRDTELDRSNSMIEVLADLRRQPDVRRLAIKGLDSTEVSTLMASMLGAALDDQGLAERIQLETAGNPFFVGEIVAHLSEVGALAQDGERWHLVADVASVGMPEGVREVVARRLRRLPEGSEPVLQAAAVIGQSFEFRLLEEVTGSDPLDALEAAAAADLVQEHDDEWAFTHALVRATLYEQLSGPRQARLHGQVADVLERRSPVPIAVVAHHAVRSAAGRAEWAARWALAAGGEAGDQLAEEAAANWGELALEILARCESRDDMLRFEAHRLAAFGWWFTERTDRMREHRAAAARLALSMGEVGLAADTLSDVYVSDFGGADLEQLPLLEEVRDRLGPDRHAERAGLLLVEAMVRNGSGYGFDAAPLATEALRLAELSGDAYLRERATNAVIGLSDGAPLDPLMRELARTTPVLPTATPQGTAAVDEVLRGLYAHVVVAIRTGDTVAFRDHIRLGEELVRRLSPTIWFVLQWRACEAAWQGRFNDAKRLAAELRSKSAMWGMHLGAAAVLNLVRTEQGYPMKAIAGLEMAYAANPNVPYLAANLAALNAEAGRVDQARRWFEMVMTDAPASLPRDYSRSPVLLFLADTCAFLEDTTSAAVLYDELLPYAGEVLVAFTGVSAHGYADRPLGRLAAILGRRHQAAVHLDCAVDLSRGFGAPPWIARALLARAQRPDRASTEAEDDAHECRRLATDLGMTRVAEAAAALL